MKKESPNTSLLPWKAYVFVTIETLFAFYIATFCIMYFFTHKGLDWLYISIFMALLYVFVIFSCVKRIIQKFSLAALMLITPIAPLLTLIIVVTLIPVLEKLQ